MYLVRITISFVRFVGIVADAIGRRPSRVSLTTFELGVGGRSQAVYVFEWMWNLCSLSYPSTTDIITDPPATVTSIVRVGCSRSTLYDGYVTRSAMFLHTSVPRR